MKKEKIKIKSIKVKSFATTSSIGLKNKTQLNDGGYTWVG